MRISIEDHARQRVLEYYRRAAMRHSLNIWDEARKVFADMRGIGSLLVTDKTPTVAKWQRLELKQLTSQRVRWCYGISVIDHADGDLIVRIVEAEHQDNMTDDAFTMQED